LKPSFNESGEKSFPAPKKGASRGQSPQVKTKGPRHGYYQFGIPRPGK
jgi:hypothetical protein